MKPRVRDRPEIGKDGKRISKSRCKWCSHYRTNHGPDDGMCNVEKKDGSWCNCIQFEFRKGEA